MAVVAMIRVGREVEINYHHVHSAHAQSLSLLSPPHHGERCPATFRTLQQYTSPNGGTLSSFIRLNALRKPGSDIRIPYTKHPFSPITFSGVN